MRHFMIEIDGSFGEGGGQIVRTAVSLSGVTGKPVRITRIRQGRPKPGLAAQHAHAILALAGICNAETAGVEPGSSEIVFSPGKIQGGSRRVEIGTAGSVTLLMQCLLPALFQADAPSSLRVQGGTDVQWSPSVDYFKNVFLPALSAFGAKVRLDVLRRGYYPKGQGEVRLEVEPGVLSAAHLQVKQPEADKRTVLGISHSSNLPEHVAVRQAESAAKRLHEAGYEAEIARETGKLPSMGSGITLWQGGKGASALGERGLPAEKVGWRAAERMILELKSPASVDVHLADQLIPYLILAGGSYTVREISLHARTNIWTAGHFLDKKVEIKPQGGLFRIESTGSDGEVSST
jgi:RNA 3'-terminal phosphate cyclase (ATP)